MSLQKRLKDDYLSKMVGIPVDNPAFDKKTAFYRGALYAIFDLAHKKDLIVKGITEEEAEKTNQ